MDSAYKRKTATLVASHLGDTHQQTFSKVEYSQLQTNNDDSDDSDNDPELADIPRLIPKYSHLSQLRQPSKAKVVADTLYNYLHSVFWICLAVFVIQYSDLVRVLRIDDRVHRIFLYTAITSWVIVLGFVGYLAVFLPLCKRKRIDDYNITHPQYIQATLALSFVAVITFIIGIWPVWSWFAIPMALSIFMGLLMIPNFIPNY